jgi:hypothetical protein
MEAASLVVGAIARTDAGSQGSGKRQAAEGNLTHAAEQVMSNRETKRRKVVDVQNPGLPVQPPPLDALHSGIGDFAVKGVVQQVEPVNMDSGRFGQIQDGFPAVSADQPASHQVL